MTSQEDPTTKEPATKETKVTPWEVSGTSTGVDYDKVVRDFGCEMINPELLERFERCTNRRAHHMIRRGVFFAHRDLELICEAKEKNLPIYLYTGRGPSSESLHIGHLIQFYINKYLQDVLDCPLVIQITDDEKYLYNKNVSELRQTYEFGKQNVKDIIACGFDPAKTYIFSSARNGVASMYEVILAIQKRVTMNQVKGIFGFNDSTNIGMIAFPAVQAAPAFATAFAGVFNDDESRDLPNMPDWMVKRTRCLIACAIDQDPYFRMGRDIAPKLGWNKPALLLSKFIPSLTGASDKMSSSAGQPPAKVSAGASQPAKATSSPAAAPAAGPTPTIFVTDTPQMIKSKINKYAFSGGRDTAEDQRKYGADLTVDIPYQYLRFFLEDDAELERVRVEYGTGKMMTSEVKKMLIKRLQELILEHQEKRKSITDELVDEFMSRDKPTIRSYFKERAPTR